MFLKIFRVLLLLLPFTFCFSADGYSAPLSSDTASTATIRVGKHKNYLRIVFETSENHAEKASVVVSGKNDIKIDFALAMTFKLMGSKEPVPHRKAVDINEMVRVSAKENSCVVTVKNLDDIRVSKLTGPSRLIVDAFYTDSPQDNRTDKTAPTQKTENTSFAFDTVVIDPGHGGASAGIRSGDYIEKESSLTLSKEIGAAFTKAGKKVFFTRKGDQTLSIGSRIKLARKLMPELFISVHMSGKRGFSIYTAPHSDAAGQARESALSKAIAQKLAGEFKTEVREEKIPLSLLTMVPATSLLIEFPDPKEFKYDRNSKRILAEIIADALSASHVSPGQSEGPEKSQGAAK
ncbi:MAG: N-acetylmuramoyl-L-alanine amidase [Nitrospirae bacterium]|nr:MAG: N-acetylmuramoyl-L-alanine amidase [Nitrospirota bacterium]